MAVRDLGYRPYEGERLPASNNSKVLLRHGFERAWGSWLVKIAVWTCWIPPFVTGIVVGILFWIGREAPPGSLPEVNAAEEMRNLYGWVQLRGGCLPVPALMPFVTLITLGAGAAAIAEDLQHGAFQFYFSKPLTAPQYLLGRIGAVATWLLLITFPAGLLVVMVLVGVAPEEMRLERLGLLLPAAFQALLISVVTSCAAVGLSSLSKSRALTMSAWLMLLVLPHAIGAIVNEVSDWPWILLISIPELLNVVGDALFKIEPQNALRWYHALPVLAAISIGAVSLALHRVRRVEVIT